jgi:hypothetical protein
MSGIEGDIIRIRINAADGNSLLNDAKSLQLEIGGGGPRRRQDGGFYLDVYVPGQRIQELQRHDLRFEVIENASEIGRARQKEVGVGDRFDGGTIAPRGLGKKE